MAYKASKNLLASRDTYNRYYGDFRGVDFSSDHTQVHEQRLAYSVNMFKDYGSKQGVAIETVPGFRPRIHYDSSTAKLNGIHYYGDKILIHRGKYLNAYKADVGAEEVETVSSPGEETMEDRKSVSFIFQNRLYILDGKHYYVYDGESVKDATENAYIPTTYIPSIRRDAMPDGTYVETPIRVEYEQRNLLTPLFRETFIGDGEKTQFVLSDPNCELISVTVDGEDGGGWELSEDGVTVVFKTAPSSPTVEGTPNIVVTAQHIQQDSEIVDGVLPISSLITECTLATVFDNRVFLSGNPNYPCHIFWCDIATDTGLPDPTYFGLYSHQQDGVNVYAPITGMLSVANTLMVLKAESQEDGCVYYHAPQQTNNDVIPVVYPSEQGLGGIGCLGACANFLDDPVFVSRFGLEGVSQLSVRLERAIEHRSSLVDAKLTECNLANASVCEWNGYLVLLADGKVFMADSRQRFTHTTGVPQYEWYYLEDIGVYDGQYTKWVYATEADGIIGYPGAIHPTLAGQTVSEGVNIQSQDDKQGLSWTINPESSAPQWIVKTTGEQTGGTFHPATIIREINGNLWFGTDNGYICSFNFDKRNEYGEIPPEFYTFNGRTIFCGCATKMDCCGIPHLTKSTVKKSTVIKTKTLLASVAKVKVRTNRQPYTQVGRIGSATLDFNSLDFSDFSFEMIDHTLHAVKGDKDKKWVEKQYFIYSDEYMKPFALYYIAFRYTVAGRYKD